jgi:transcriptional regulator with XRE-family HTH domain
MELTQAEIIQILRKRSGLNQGELGVKAFKMTFESGRTKIKNLELGKQKPSKADLVQIADALGVSMQDIEVGSRLGKSKGAPDPMTVKGVWLNRRVVEYFPGIDAYLEMLNKALNIQDAELIGHIAERIAERLHSQKAAVAVNV